MTRSPRTGFLLASRIFVGVIAAALVLTGTASAQTARVGSAQDACAILKRAAVEYRLSARELTGRYYCDYVDPPVFPDEFYLLALRYHAEPEEKVGSDLLGWFVVRISDGQLMEYDMGDEQIKPLRAASRQGKSP